jgi:putative SOS response-associated peptidase YedK
VSEIKLVFSIPPNRPTPNFAPSWNAAPTDQLPIVRFDARDGERSLDLARWGLVPYWAKDIKVGFANINAKAEGIENRPAFRDAFQRRRCLVPVNQKTTTGKQPYAIAFADRRIMALAGLSENWRSPAGEWVRSFAIITCAPNALCAELHDRMPVVLAPEAWPLWLGQEPADPRQLKALLAPYPAERMTCWPVSPRVGNGSVRHRAYRSAARDREGAILSAAVLAVSAGLAVLRRGRRSWYCRDDRHGGDPGAHGCTALLLRG